MIPKRAHNSEATSFNASLNFKICKKKIAKKNRFFKKVSVLEGLNSETKPLRHNFKRYNFAMSQKARKSKNFSVNWES